MVSGGIVIFRYSHPIIVNVILHESLEGISSDIRSDNRSELEHEHVTFRRSKINVRTHAFSHNVEIQMAKLGFYDKEVK